MTQNRCGFVGGYVRCVVCEKSREGRTARPDTVAEDVRE